MSLTLKQLRYCIAAADQGQFSAAAAVMNVTQSSITLAIKAVEDSLGYPLFRRTAQGVELTPSGERFLQHARNVVAMTQEMMTLPPADYAACPEKVQIAMSDTITGYYLPGLLEAFRREFPSLQVEAIELPRPEIERRVAEGELELGLALTSNIRHPGLARQVLLRSPRHVWLGIGHRLSDRDEISLAELQEEDYLLLLTDDHEDTMSRLWTRLGFAPRIALRTHSIEGIRSIIAGGHGVAILSDMVYRAWSLEGRRILRKPLRESIPSMDTGLIWKAGGTLSPTAERVVALARRLARE